MKNVISPILWGVFFFFCQNVLANFDPKYEGNYGATLQCVQSVPGQPCALKFNDMGISIANTGPLAGVLVSVNNREFGVQYYQLSVLQFENGGAQIQGNAEKDHKNVEFRFELNAEAKTLTGWIADYDRGMDIRVDGKHEASPVAYYVTNPTVVSQDELIGVYQGNISSVDGKLVIKRKLLGDREGQLAASFISYASTASGFPFVEYLPWAGVINLVRVDPQRGFVKWTARVTRGADGIALEGMGYSAYGLMKTGLSFKK